jgi:hypothetical protein
MARTSEAKREPRGKARIRAENVEMFHAPHRIGAVSDAELRKATLRMLGRTFCRR